MQFCRWQPSCTMTLSMSTLLMIFTLLPSLHIAPKTLRLMLLLSLQSQHDRLHVVLCKATQSRIAIGDLQINASTQSSPYR